MQLEREIRIIDLLITVRLKEKCTYVATVYLPKRIQSYRPNLST